MDLLDLLGSSALRALDPNLKTQSIACVIYDKLNEPKFTKFMNIKFIKYLVDSINNKGYTVFFLSRIICIHM